MPLYDFALLPVESDMRELFCRVAEETFGDLRNDYILNIPPENSPEEIPKKRIFKKLLNWRKIARGSSKKSALPHISLCQFETPREDDAIDVFLSFPEHRDVALQVYPPLLRPSKEHAGLLLAECPVKKTAEFQSLQEEVTAHVKWWGCEIIPSKEGPYPYLVLGAFAEVTNRLPPLKALPQEFPILYRANVGVAGKFGRYEKSLCTLFEAVL